MYVCYGVCACYGRECGGRKMCLCMCYGVCVCVLSCMYVCYDTCMCVMVENAVVEADRDVEAHKRRVLLEEEACGQMGGVREVETTVRETINNEMGELEMIKDNCRVDLDAIGGCGLD